MSGSAKIQLADNLEMAPLLQSWTKNQAGDGDVEPPRLQKFGLQKCSHVSIRSKEGGDKDDLALFARLESIRESALGRTMLSVGSARRHSGAEGEEAILDYPCNIGSEHTDSVSFGDSHQSRSGDEVKAQSEDKEFRHNNNNMAARPVLNKGKGAVNSSPITYAWKTSRQVIDNDHVGKLVRDYWKYFAEFSTGQKHRSKQLIPSKVWNNVYSDYKLMFPQSQFIEGSLKDHLRDSVKDMKSGVNNPEEFEGGTLQNDELMLKLMETESWKGRNVLRTRMNAAHGRTSQPSSQPVDYPADCGQVSLGDLDQDDIEDLPTDVDEVDAGAEVLLATPQPRRVKPVGKPPTKSQNLKRASESMSKMLGEFKRTQSARKAEADLKRRWFENQDKESEAKKEESELRRTNLKNQNMLSEITVLKEKIALGLLTQEEFTKKCRVVFDM